MRKASEFTAEEVSNFISYDPETGKLTAKRKRSSILSGSVIGHIDNLGYVRFELFGKKLRGHRVAWLLHTGEWPSDQIDHINGDRSDNRICNLREANNQQNMQNAITQPGKTSKHQGVCWHTQKNKWQAKIKVSGKRIYLGSFEKEEDAYAAYLAAKAKHHTFNPFVREGETK